MSKRIILFLIVAAMLLGVVGVGQAKQVTIEVWFSDYNTNTTKWIEEQLIPSFEKDNPDIKVNISYVGWGVFNQKLKAAMAAGMSPDIYTGGSTFRGQAGAQGFGMNIDKYTKDTKNWPDRKDFFPGSWEAVVWEGHDYGIPILTAPRTIIYRSDLMAEGGFNPDVNPTTWEDVMKTSTKLSKVDGSGNATRWGFNLASPNMDFWMSLLLQDGGVVCSSDGSQPLFNGQPGIESLEYYTNFYKAQQAFGGKVPSGGFAAGAYVMDWANGKTVTDTLIKSPDLAGNLRVGYPMKRKLQVAPAFSDSLFMASMAKNPDEAWEFMKYFAKPENMLAYNETLSYFPPRKASLRTSYLEKYPQVKDVFEKVMPYSVGRPSAAAWAGLTTAVKDALSGSVTAQAALMNAEKVWLKF